MSSGRNNLGRGLRISVPMVLALLLIAVFTVPAAKGFAPTAIFSSRASVVVTPTTNSRNSYISSSTKINSAVEEKADTRNPLKQAYRIYTGYAGRLWKETNPKERSKIANDKVAQTVRDMHHVLTSEHETISSSSRSDDDQKRLEASTELLKACEKMISILDDKPKESKEVAITEKSESAPAKKEKKQRSILFGALMGAVVTCWVFSGNYIFTTLFCLMTILGQLEYYRMIMNTGVFPARRISVLGATSMFVTALLSPDLHQLCLPLFGTYAMIWKLTMRRKVATIPEIATTFTGMFYLGYVPSFWVRIRTIGAGKIMEPTRLFPATLAMRNFLEQKFGFLVPKLLVPSPITSGSVFIFWSWISLAFSDVGAYFVGRKYGKTKLGAISPAAGATSPNKSVEGVIGGCIASAIFSIAGAWAQKWPYFVITGALHGTILGLLGLIGDLTASMLKRDAGLKDFGDLLPEHGGIMDRVDSFVWTAPYSWLVAAYIIPMLKAWAGTPP